MGTQTSKPVLLAVMLTNSLHRVIARQFYETATRFTLQQDISASVGSHLVEIRVEIIKGTTIVRAVIPGSGRRYRSEIVFHP